MKCNIPNSQNDTLSHLLVCPKISAGSTLHLDNIYGDVIEQQQVAREFVRFMRRRTQLLEEADPAGLQLQPTGGVIPGPSFSATTVVENGYTAI